MDLKKILKKIGSRKNNLVRNRIKIRAAHGVRFYFDNYELPIVNISHSGIGILSHPDRPFKVGEVINGKIKSPNADCNLQLKIIHTTGQMTGARIQNADVEYQDFLNNYFASEVEGIKLQEIDRSRLSEDVNGEPHWFYSDSNHEIYFTTKNGEVTTIQITYQNYVIVIDAKDQISTGVIWEAEVEKDIEPKSSDLVKGTNAIPDDIKEHIVRFVGASNHVPKEIRQKIESKLSKKFLLS